MLKLVLLLVALCGVALAVALGYLVARATIRPVERLTRAAEHVAATQDLEATIDEDGNDELSRLAHAFNAMLAALAASRQQQAQLVSDAGHELRTPLTSLRTNIEVLMRVHDLPDADRTDLLSDVKAQLEELTTLIGDVVELARQDERQPEPTEVRLDEIVRRAVERAQRRAPALPFSLSLTPGSVRAQPAMLERAVLNVLDNAAKWSPAGSVVDVYLARLDRWHLEIRDQGPGIAEATCPRSSTASTGRRRPGRCRGRGWGWPSSPGGRPPTAARCRSASHPTGARWSTSSCRSCPRPSRSTPGGRRRPTRVAVTVARTDRRRRRWGRESLRRCSGDQLTSTAAAANWAL